MMDTRLSGEQRVLGSSIPSIGTSRHDQSQGVLEGDVPRFVSNDIDRNQNQYCNLEKWNFS